MAVIENISGLEAVIIVNGKELEEYDIAANDSEQQRREHPNKITKYIKSEAGAKFSVCLKIHQEFQDRNDCSHRAELWLDGKLVWTEVKRKDNWNTCRDDNNITISCVTSKKEGVWIKKHLSFAELNIGEGTAGKESCVSPELGVIKLEYSRCKVVSSVFKLSSINSRRKPAWNMLGDVKDLQSSRELSAKLLKGKALSHQTKLSNESIASEPNWVNAQTIDDVHPYAAFEFRYGSHKDLQDQLVIPRSPSLARTSTPESDGPDDEEIRNSIEALQAILSKRAGIKRERSVEPAVATTSKHVDSDELTIVDCRPAKRRDVPTEDDKIVDLD